MSVIGLTWVLTHRLMRWRSFQACVVSTTSRGVEGLVLHSGSYSAQNSIQPIGARAVSPIVMNIERSAAVLGAGVPNRAAAMTPAARPRLRSAFARVFMSDPFPVLWGHMSQKVFAPPLR